jgi:hypothetical protein
MELPNSNAMFGNAARKASRKYIGKASTAVNLYLEPASKQRAIGTQIKSCGTSAGINRKIKLLKALALRVAEAIAAKPGPRTVD